MPICEKTRRVTCSQCQILLINGYICHEHGCPDAWKDTIRECRWCGSDFPPAFSDERFCSPECAESYAN